MDGGKSEIHDRDARYEITVGMYPGLFMHVPPFCTIYPYLSVFRDVICFRLVSGFLMFHVHSCRPLLSADAKT